MEAENRAGMYELAVRGVRRLAGLAANSDEGDVVRDALVRELRVVLDLDSVTVVTCDQGAAARHAKALLEAAEVEGERARDRVRRLVLELRPPAPAPAREAVILLAREARRLGADEVTAAGALVDVAAVVLGLLGARHDAATDELTGCLNRRAALARLGEEIARADRTRSPVSCLMFDIDCLKQINDTYGHLEGDRVLRETGASLRGELRGYDVAARYGGDEFVVVLPATEQRTAVQAATRMSAAVARISFPADATAPTSLGVRFGAATSRAGDLPATLLARADQALLNAKRRTPKSRPPSGEPQADA
ncbi:MAG: GGDEF domain-containing protein [Solirubrobacteraceae bacterium]